MALIQCFLRITDVMREKMGSSGKRTWLILLTAGTLGNVVRVLVPLTVEDAVLEEGLAVFEAAMGAALG